jgi:hypothetical protein
MNINLDFNNLILNKALIRELTKLTFLILLIKQALKWAWLALLNLFVWTFAFIYVAINRVKKKEPKFRVDISKDSQGKDDGIILTKV